MRNDENRPIDNPDNRNEELSWNDPKHPRYGEHKDKLSYDPKLGYQEPANSPSIAEDPQGLNHTGVDYGVQESDYGDEEEPTVNLHQELADAEKRLRHEE